MANILISLMLSFIIAGLGIVYVGDLELGIGLILLWLILCLIAIHAVGLTSIIVGVIAMIIWSYSLFATFFLAVTS